jgi:cysteine synthase A
MKPLSSVLDAIGNTPLIRLRKASELTGCEIYGKAEFLNPGQSVKDRAALWIVRDAERKGLLKPGGTIVEGTAGNTGIGLTMVAKALGYKSVIVIPETQSDEKKQMLRLGGAQLIEVPAVPYRNPNNYVKVSGRLAEQIAADDPNGAVWANQFDNVANRQAHIESTGPEIWDDTGGKVDAFICSLYNFYDHGELKAEGNSITEGIGNGRITANLEDAPIDVAFAIPDSESIPLVFDMIETEGLCLGGSSGVNLAGAIRLAGQLGPGHTIVTILADYGSRYASKLFNPEFLRSKDLPVPPWLLDETLPDVPYEEVA